jgi:hypothetical protein
VAYPPYFKCETVEALLEAVRKSVATSEEWKVREIGKLGGDSFLTVNYTGSRFGDRELGFVLSFYPRDPGKAYLTMHSDSWNRQSGRDNFWSQYALAEELAMPVFRAAGRILGRRLRLVRPKDKINPLRGEIAQAFQSFAFLANKSCLHPLDKLRFYEFIRCAHKFTSVLTPEDIAVHLRRVEFGEDMIARLADEYEIGRRVLAVEIWPWELRAQQRRERGRIRQESLDYSRSRDAPTDTNVPPK